MEGKHQWWLCWYQEILNEYSWPLYCRRLLIPHHDAVQEYRKKLFMELIQPGINAIEDEFHLCFWVLHVSWPRTHEGKIFFYKKSYNMIGSWFTSVEEMDSKHKNWSQVAWILWMNFLNNLEIFGRATWTKGTTRRKSIPDKRAFVFLVAW